MNTTKIQFTTAQLSAMTDDQLKGLGFADRTSALAAASDAGTKPSLWQASKRYLGYGAVFGVGTAAGYGIKVALDSRKATHSAQITQ